MTLPFTNFIFDYMRAGLAADRPANPETDNNVNPEAVIQYFATDTKVLSTWSTDDTTWYETAFTNLTAASISFDNGPSGMTATNVQDAIDEVHSDIATDAGGIVYDNTGSGLSSVNVQDAIDELVSGIGYTDERAQDAVGNILVDGTTINFTYNDGANTITAEVQNIATTHFAANVIDTDTALTANSDARLATQKAVKAYVDAVSAAAYTDEKAEDAIGGIVTDTNTINFTYDDAGNTIKADLLVTMPAQGRLTPSSGTPVITANVTGAATIYYEPHNGQYAPVVKSGTSTLEMRQFTSLSQALSDTTKSPAAAGNLRCYDTWMWDDSGTLRNTRGPGWTDGGRTFTCTIASPGVVTLNSHGFFEGQPVVPTTTGALPTGYTAGTIYYVAGASLTTNTFRLSTTPGGAAINTSGSQSGTHTMTTYVQVRGTGAGTEEWDTTTFPGYIVNKYAITNGPGAGKGRYTGTILTNDAGTVDYIIGANAGAANGEGTWLGVYSHDQPLDIKLSNFDTVDSWTYTSTAWRLKNAAGSAYLNRIVMVSGDIKRPLEAIFNQQHSTASGFIQFPTAIGQNSTLIWATGRCLLGFSQDDGTTLVNQSTAWFIGFPTLGMSYLAPMEGSTASGTSTHYGDGGDNGAGTAFGFASLFYAVARA